MKRFFYLLTAALLMGSAAWADNADFENKLPEGWDYVGTMNYYERPKTGSYSIGNSSGSGWETNRGNYIRTTKLEGNITFWMRSYKANYTGYVSLFELSDDGETVASSPLISFNSSSTTFAEKSYTLAKPTRLAIVINYGHIDNMTYTPSVTDVDGSALAVPGYKSGDTFAFGTVDAGTTKQLLLTNPGTADVNLTISTTGGYTATPATAKIAAKGEMELNITVPAATANGTLTIKPAEAGVESFTLNLKCTVKNPAKMFEDFSGNALPDEWETIATGDYASSYTWSFASGYAAYTQGSNYGRYYDQALVSPRMKFTEGEKVLFKAMKAGTSNPYMVVEYLVGDTWTATAEGAFNNVFENEWTEYEVTIPASATRIRFNGCCFAIDDIYGGELNIIPMPKLEVVGYANGSTLSWGFADVPAGTEKTITLRNSGKAELNATIAATNDFTLSATTATIAAGETFDLTIGTPAHDGNGTLTITPQAESGLQPYTLTLTSYYKVPKAVMELDKRTIAFGKLYADATETVTVQNTGDARLTVAIANNNTDRFEATPAQLTVEAGESQLLTIKYKHDAAKSGTYTATFTLTPNDGSAQTITATATNKRQGVWSEDFEEGIPTAWTNDGWTIDRKWNEASSVNHAYAGYNSGYLITPRLKAEKNEELSFDFVSSYATLKVEYASTLDAANWTLFNEFEEDSTITFKAPEAGTYYLRFSGSGSYLDNFEGFQLDQLAADAAIIASSLPATGNQFAVYNASVTVQNKGSQAQTVVARLLVNGSAKDTKEAALAIEGTTKIDLSFTPETALENAVARIEVTLKGVSSFAAKTVETTLNVAPAPTLDETVAPELATGTLPVVTLKYTAVNGWNTIAVPFALNDDILTQLFGADYEVYEFKSYANDTIKMHVPTMFVAGYAYLVYARSAVAQPDGIALENIRIETTTPKYDASNGVQFTATFTPITAGELTDKYTVAPGLPLLVKGTEESTLSGFRAYFTLGESITKTPELAFYTANGIPTGITLAKTPTTAAPEGIYNLKGMRVTTMQKGLYIVNGKKVLVK